MSPATAHNGVRSDSPLQPLTGGSSTTTGNGVPDTPKVKHSLTGGCRNVKKLLDCQTAFIVLGSVAAGTAAGVLYHATKDYDKLCSRSIDKFQEDILRYNCSNPVELQLLEIRQDYEKVIDPFFGFVSGVFLGCALSMVNKCHREGYLAQAISYGRHLCDSLCSRPGADEPAEQTADAEPVPIATTDPAAPDIV
ncbi:hypothetical protein [Endozoicomonas sp. ONNA2]|uniref:hypothetical protein n=1 Tax=Endozoicomonas sp. ONNA2 TaxID=2828741 RepID=UPI0021487A86|nr:hypothetical protein [Endozoicomonas sp. ONNA2]